MLDHPPPPFEPQQQPMPGRTEATSPRPDGETNYKGADQLLGNGRRPDAVTNGEDMMYTATSSRSVTYRVRGRGGEWRVETDQRAGMAYASKEAAFESAVSAALNAIRDGYDVVIVMPGGSNTTLGVEDSGRGLDTEEATPLSQLP